MSTDHNDNPDDQGISNDKLHRISVSFAGTDEQFSQLLTVPRSYGRWDPNYRGLAKVYNFNNGVRLIWISVMQRIEIVGRELRTVETVEKRLARLMTRYGFMEDVPALKRRIRDLELALTPPVKSKRAAKARQPPRPTSQHKAPASKPELRSTQTTRKPRSRA